MKEITCAELKAMRDKNEPHQLIDVREPYEIEIAAFGGDPIPMGEIIARKDEIKTDVPVIVHCRSGKRSAAVIQSLEMQYGFNNLYNLKGGIIAWANEVDNSLQVS